MGPRRNWEGLPSTFLLNCLVFDPPFDFDADHDRGADDDDGTDDRGARPHSYSVNSQKSEVNQAKDMHIRL